MPELTPLDDNRQEHFLNGEDLEPITRREHFYAGRESELPAGHQEPETREEWFIQKYRGGGGDVTVVPLSVTDNGTYSEEGKAYSPVSVDVPLPQNAYLLKSVANLPQAIASFNDGEDMVMPSLKVAIEPQQEGSGDPSPTNVRPISGWTEEVITRTGKNLLGGEAFAEEFEGAVGYSIDTTNKTFTYQRSKEEWTPNVKFKENTSYTFLITYTGGRNNSFRIIYTNGTTGQINLEQATEKTVYIVTTPSNKTIKAFDVSWYIVNSVTVYYDESGIFEGTITRDDFEPYAGTTTTIPFTDGQGQSVEVFGGSVDVVNGGEQPRTYAKIALADIPKSKYGTYQYGIRTIVSFFDSIPNASLMTGMSNTFVLSVSGESYNVDKCSIIFSSGSAKTSFLISTQASGLSADASVTEIDAWLRSIDAYIVYPLATPTTFYTQPIAIKSLRGVNNVWADTGDIKDAEYFSKEV